MRTVNTAKQRAFLAAYAESASITVAARAAKVDRKTHYDWLEIDPEYPALFDRARERAAQTLEDDAVEWARKGLFEPNIYQGRFQYPQIRRTICTLPDGREVYEDEFAPEQLAEMEVTAKRTVIGDDLTQPPLGVYRRSEGLLGRLLKAFMPERYAERGAVELTGKGGGAIENTLTVSFVRPGEQK